MSEQSMKNNFFALRWNSWNSSGSKTQTGIHIPGARWRFIRRNSLCLLGSLCSALQIFFKLFTECHSSCSACLSHSTELRLPFCVLALTPAWPSVWPTAPGRPWQLSPSPLSALLPRLHYSHGTTLPQPQTDREQRWPRCPGCHGDSGRHPSTGVSRQQSRQGQKGHRQQKDAQF